MATKASIEIARHRLDGGNPEARVRRLDLLLAGDQRDVVGADPVDDLVVDLARQQPQRQPDHAGRMAEHPLDGEMGLAGVGRAEHGGDAGATQAAVAGHGRRERDGHPISRLGMARFSERARLSVSQCDAGQGARLTIANESGTKRARIADSGRCLISFTAICRPDRLGRPQHRVSKAVERRRCALHSLTRYRFGHIRRVNLERPQDSVDQAVNIWEDLGRAASAAFTASRALDRGARRSPWRRIASPA